MAWLLNLQQMNALLQLFEIAVNLCYLRGDGKAFLLFLNRPGLSKVSKTHQPDPPRKQQKCRLASTSVTSLYATMLCAA